jgi:hypothetical protein
MSKSDVLEGQWLDLYFNGTAIPDIAENDTTGPATTLTIGLHTADPGEAGDQTTNEATYLSYTRVTVARVVGSWLRAGSTINPVVSISFPVATAGGQPGDTIETLTHWSIGTGVTDNVGWSGTITPNIVIPVGGGGVQPTIRGNDNPPASTITED